MSKYIKNIFKIQELRINHLGKDNFIKKFIKNIQKNHRQKIFGLIGLFMAITVGTLIFILYVYINTQYYWQTVIFRTQTVDFNILSHTLPNQISEYLIDGDMKRIQRIIDSNYGLSGIIVTDCASETKRCSDQKILAISNVSFARKGSEIIDIQPTSIYTKEKINEWVSKFKNQEHLDKEIFMILRNPPPNEPEWKFDDPRSTEISMIDHNNTGRPVGRIYLFRTENPGILTELQSLIEIWQKTPLPIAQTSSSRAISIWVFYSIIGTSIIVWFVCMFYYSRTLKANLDLLDAKTQLKQTKYSLEQTSDRLEKLEQMWVSYQRSIDKEIVSVLANETFKLEDFYKRLDIDIRNIVHDLTKAPLLAGSSVLTGVEANSSSLKVKIQKSIDTLNWVIDDLRNVASIKSEKVSVNKSIDLLVKKMPTQCSNITVLFEPDLTQELYIFCNDWHIRSIVKNIYYNSLSALNKYISRRKINKGIIKIKTEKIGKTIRITVTDNGPGIPEEFIDSIYRKPTWLGLGARRGHGSLIVYSYLQLHNGTIDVRNTDNGAEIIIEFNEYTS